MKFALCRRPPAPQVLAANVLLDALDDASWTDYVEHSSSALRVLKAYREVLPPALASSAAEMLAAAEAGITFGETTLWAGAAKKYPVGVYPVEARDGQPEADADA